MSDIAGTIDREKVLLILEWCQKRFGKSKFWEKYPILHVYKTNGASCDGDKNGRFGHCMDGEISIFLGKHKTVRELCGTVIHEYKHYLLSDDEFYEEYKKLKKQGLKENDALRKHPHEKIAKKFEDKWKHTCYNDLKNQLYKKED